MIYAKSPYIVHVDDAGLVSIEFKISCYVGTTPADRATGTSYEFAIDAINGEVTFDVSPYIQEFLELETRAEAIDNSGNICWVYMEIDKDTGSGLSGSYSTYLGDSLATLGYTTFEEGVNYTTEPTQLITDARAYTSYAGINLIKGANTRLRIPVFRSLALLGSPYRLYSFDGVNPAFIEAPSVTRTLAANIDDQYDYISIPNGTKFLEYRDEADTDSTTYYVTEVDDCQNTPLRVFFINRYGFIDEIQFFGRTKDSYSVESSSYKKSILSGGTYESWDRQQTEINKRGTRRITASSGMYPEGYNEMFKQLMFSTQVWVAENQQGVIVAGDQKPVRIIETDIEYKYSKYEKKIEYTLTFEFANSVINDVA